MNQNNAAQMMSNAAAINPAFMLVSLFALFF